MRKAGWAILAVLVVGIGVWAHGLVNPFDLEPSARAAGYGGAFCGLAEGSDALLYNPGALILPHRPEFSSDYMSQLGGLSSVVWLAGASGNWAGGIAYLSAGGIETEPGGDALAFNQVGVALAGAWELGGLPLPLPLRLGVGATLRYVRAQLADKAGSGLSLGLGALGIVDVGAASFRVGIAMDDLGFGIGFGEDVPREAWSVGIRLGAALVLPNFKLDMDYGGGLRFGFGFPFNQALELRAGIALEGGMTRFALGLGFGWRSFTLDYALITHPLLPSSHRFGFGFSF